MCVRRDSKFLLEYREVVERGGAEHEASTVNSGVLRWQKTLVWAKALVEEKNTKVVLVADGIAMESW